MTRRLATRSARGWSLSELLVVMAIIGIMAFIAIPFLLTYIPGATVNYAAREVQGALQRAKLMAVATRQSICVQIVAGGGGYQFLQGGCTGTVWKGPGTDGAGTFKMGAGLTIAQVSGPPIFSQFGMAQQAGQFQITTTGAPARTVTVALGSGRVTIP